MNCFLARRAVFLPQGGLSSERTVIYLSALRKLAFKQKQIKKMTKDSESPDHRSGVFTVFVSFQRSRKAARSLEKIARESLRAERELASLMRSTSGRFDTSKNSKLYTPKLLYTLRSAPCDASRLKNSTLYTLRAAGSPALTVPPVCQI